jgi:response regulator RpfG family c-di-GMP phosphodiesterase
MTSVSSEAFWRGQRAERLDLQIERQARLMAVLAGAAVGPTSDIGPLLGRLYAHDPGSLAHVERVADASVRLGRELGMTADRLIDLERAALLHDIGRLVVPDAPRGNGAALSPGDGRQRIEQSRVAREIAAVVPVLTPAAALIGASFEWFDGSGLPQGLKGTAIPLGARILSLVDAADTLTILCLAYEHPLAAVRDEFIRSAGTRFDPAVVATWMRLSDDESETLMGWAGASAPVH